MTPVLPHHRQHTHIERSALSDVHADVLIGSLGLHVSDRGVRMILEVGRLELTVIRQFAVDAMQICRYHWCNDDRSAFTVLTGLEHARSEERRVGKECRYRW